MSQHGFVKVTTSSWSGFEKAVNGNGYNTDGYYGDQCWDGADLFWRNAVGRGFSTGGTGYARGAWEAAKSVNAGKDFDLITSKTAIKPGDWIVFKGSSAGHVGMATTTNQGGYVKLLAQNQSGSNVNAGYPFTIKSFSLANMLGAFRYKKWYVTTAPKKSIDTIAHEVINGSWGDGDTRVKRLKAAGYDPAAVQKRVNQILGTSSKPTSSAPKIGDKVKTTATKDSSTGVKLNTSIINDGKSVYSSKNTKGYAVLTYKGVARASVPVSSLKKV